MWLLTRRDEPVERRLINMNRVEVIAIHPVTGPPGNHELTAYLDDEDQEGLATGSLDEMLKLRTKLVLALAAVAGGPIDLNVVN